MPDKATLINELEAGHAKFRAAIADLPEAAYTETWLGTWSLNNLLAHMAGWFREIGPGFARVARGERPTPEGVDWSDVDAWNATFATQATFSGRAALADWDDAYASYLAAARSLPEDLYGVEPGRDRPRIGNRLIDGAGIGHFAEHQPELDEWLKGR